MKRKEVEILEKLENGNAMALKENKETRLDTTKGDERREREMML